MSDINEWTRQIHEGDSEELLQEMPESSVHMAMTSPPYFQQRDYGVDGQIGLEETVEEYIDRLVSVFDELYRVIRDDGSLWLNIGDGYNDGTTSANAEGGVFARKDKMLVPHRLAIALQESGWVVREDCVWKKKNPMPQSVKDRFNETKEFVFHLTKSSDDYWFDLDAVRVPVRSDESVLKQSDGELHPKGKNPGDVFEIATETFSDSHFAVYPKKLCRPPIKATCPPKVCSECGTPHERVVERKDEYQTAEPGEDKFEGQRNDTDRRGDGTTFSNNPEERKRPQRELKGWESGCECDGDVEAGVVLDPFAGAGTTCLVGDNLNRRFVGLELNDEYVTMAQDRIGIEVDDPDELYDANSALEW